MSTKKLSLIVVVAATVYFVFFKETKAEWVISNLKSNPSVVVAFGDSLTSGVGASKGYSYPDQLSSMIGTKILNTGVSGYTSANILKTLDKNVLNLKPDLVLITATGNDIIQKVQFNLAMDRLEQIFSKTVQSGAMVAFLSLKPPLVNSRWYKTSKEIAKKNGVIWVDRVLKGLWSSGSLMHDTIHPNAKGYQLIAKKVYETLRDKKVFN